MINNFTNIKLIVCNSNTFTPFSKYFLDEVQLTARLSGSELFGLYILIMMLIEIAINNLHSDLVRGLGSDVSEMFTRRLSDHEDYDLLTNINTTDLNSQQMGLLTNWVDGKIRFFKDNDR